LRVDAELTDCRNARAFCLAARRRGSVLAGLVSAMTGVLRQHTCWTDRRAEAPATMDCRKSETELNSPNEQSCALPLLASAAIPRSRDLSAKKARRKKLPAKILCNALISLDSVERIQGNPRESNAHNLGFFALEWPAPRKPKSTAWACGGPGKGAESAPAQCEAALIIGASGLRRLHVIEGAVRRLLGRQTNRPGISERSLSAGMKLGAARGDDGARRGDAHRRP
jgi:hypothetical protein